MDIMLNNFVFGKNPRPLMLVTWKTRLGVGAYLPGRPKVWLQIEGRDKEFNNIYPFISSLHVCTEVWFRFWCTTKKLVLFEYIYIRRVHEMMIYSIRKYYNQSKMRMVCNNCLKRICWIEYLSYFSLFDFTNLMK